MARPKTLLNQAAEKFECETCQAQPDEACINRNTGRVVATHTRRTNQVCQESFLSLPGDESNPMWCARRRDHKSRHQTVDKRLEWSKTLDGEDFRDLIRDEFRDELQETA